ncbi:MAG: sulfatase-like hydrolase/transferase [Acidobacteria bacterium]|nr:sulfatase-like hydrolase/transferase [Acidobacteriota bacterium]
MNRRHFFLSSSAACLPHAAFAAERPNIVYVLADDLGRGDLGCYNPDSRIPTPNMDKLAGQGVRFSDAHSPSSVCTPTRYGILTGRYCWRSKLKQGVLGGESPYLPEPGRMTVASMLRDQGYRTAAIGKWHLGLGNDKVTDYSKPLRPGPLDAGYDSFFGIPASLDMAPYLYVENDRAVEQPTKHVDGVREQRGIFWREGGVAPSFKHIDVLPRISERAIQFLDQQKGAQRPFFLYFALTGPHTPWLPTKQFQGKAKAGPYGDFVVQVDDLVGQVMAALERNGLAGNTLLVVTSDNGAHWTPEEIEMHKHRANGRLRGQKADIFDGGHRIPFLARWPGRIQPNRVSDQIVCLTDLMATAAEITGAKLPRDSAEDSFSMVPALLGSKPVSAVREVIIHHSSQGLFAVRQGEWKLALGRGSWGFSTPQKITPKPGEPEGELYNMKADPLEQDNLYFKRPDIVKNLKALLEKYQREGRSRPV